MTIETGPPDMTLLIPVTGLIEVVESTQRIDIDRTLTARHETMGALVSIDLYRDHVPIGTVHFRTAGPVNPRARTAVAMITGGVHVVVTGWALFTDLPDDTVRAVVYELSRRA